MFHLKTGIISAYYRQAWMINDDYLISNYNRIAIFKSDFEYMGRVRDVKTTVKERCTVMIQTLNEINNGH